MINIHSKKDKNYLDYIPIRNPEFPWKYDENNVIIVEMHRNGVFDKIAQKFFKVPSKSDIALDEYGSFIWEYIDGNNTIFEISNKVSNKFGKDAEPLYNRLVKFFKILHDNKFITFKDDKKHK